MVTDRTPVMNREDLAQAVFGAFDGQTSALGVIVPLLSAYHLHTILAAVVGLAVASAVGMGAGEYLSDDTKSAHRAAVMAGATALGTLAPALPFLLLLPRAVATPVSAVIALGITLLIGRVRHAYLSTLLIFVVTVLATLVVAVAFGTTG